MLKSQRLTAKVSSLAAVAALSMGGLGAATVAAAGPAQAADCVKSARVKIDKGFRGIDSVKEAQCRLNILGYGLKVDGVFGSSTDKAVRDFQSKNGLTSDGVVGSSTWAKLVSKTGGDSGSTSSRDEKVNKVISFAKAQLGEKYVYGAEGSSTWDCSGLTQMAYKQVGITLARKSTSQHQGLTEVSAGNRKAGDLIWWTGKTHVGIYIGNGQLIDAARSKGKVAQRNVYSYEGKSARYFRVIK
ncbi:C40 family peptidase [Demetria terragena]|uniref:C40 family peptidase n=1 Tax=Demetria terragena TaxID=63959 RepID=UPI0003682D04|nr:NlpC/P60 family protein [Demetria terragena]